MYAFTSTAGVFVELGSAKRMLQEDARDCSRFGQLVLVLYCSSNLRRYPIFFGKKDCSLCNSLYTLHREESNTKWKCIPSVCMHTALKASSEATSGHCGS